jgi:hypothetical protein
MPGIDDRTWTADGTSVVGSRDGKVIRWPIPESLRHRAEQVAAALNSPPVNPVWLTPHQQAIYEAALDYQRKHPGFTATQVHLLAATGYSKVTIWRTLNLLVRKGLGDRPPGMTTGPVLVREAPGPILQVASAGAER